jgi:hypothetical protein
MINTTLLTTVQRTADGRLLTGHVELPSPVVFGLSLGDVRAQNLFWANVRSQMCLEEDKTYVLIKYYVMDQADLERRAV